MKRIILIFFLCTSFLAAQSQTKVAPDCQLQLTNSTAPTISGNWDNRPSSANQGQPCTYWELHYSAFTTTSSFSIQMESAGDNSGSPGTFSILGSAGTTVPTGVVSVANTYVAFVRINLTSVSSGTVGATLLGWRPNAVTINGGSSGPTANVNVAQFGGNNVVTGTGASGTGIPRVTVSNDSSFQIAGDAAVLSGQQGVTGSAVALATNTVKNICVKALIGNTINVYVGPTGITTSTGMELAPGQAVCEPVTNTNLVFVIASTTGASVSWIATN